MLRHMTRDAQEHPQKHPRKKSPSIRTLTRWVMDGVARCQDGCRIEPDGDKCQHGSRNWLRVLGIL